MGYQKSEIEHPRQACISAGGPRRDKKDGGSRRACKSVQAHIEFMSSHLLDLLCRSRYYYNFLFRSPKAGAHAKLCVQLKGHEASSKARRLGQCQKRAGDLVAGPFAPTPALGLLLSKNHRACMQDVKNVARMYIFYNSKEDACSEAVKRCR